MRRELGELVKEVRVNQNMTQRQFANIFYVTEKTISNYENGARTPGVDFLTVVCDEFNLSLDYFMNRDREESKSEDLVIAEKNGKYAIYDKAQSVYLTQHIFDKILIGSEGKHICQKCKDHYYDEGNCIKGMGEPYYSVLVDNNGMTKEFPNLVMGINGGFDIHGVCIGYDRKEKKYFLVDGNGEKRSEGYNVIMPADREFRLGLYYARKEPTTKENIREFRSCEILSSAAEINSCTIEDETTGQAALNELYDIDNVKEYIGKYGPSILNYTPSEIFRKAENYAVIAIATFEYIKKYPKFYNKILDCMLKKLNFEVKLTNVTAEQKEEDEYKLFPFNYGIDNDLLITKTKNDLYDLYRLLKLI